MCETNDWPLRMSLGGCSSFSAVGSEKPNVGSTNETSGSAHVVGVASAKNNWIGSACCGEGTRKMAVVGRSEKKLIQETFPRSSRSMMVPVMGLYPPGGGKISFVV